MTKHMGRSQQGEEKPQARFCRRCGSAVAGFAGYCKRCAPNSRVAWRVRIDQHLVAIERAVSAIRRALQEDR